MIATVLERSATLKSYVTQFDADSFCGFCAFFIRQRSQGTLPGKLSGFQSVQKDLTYLAALNYFNQSPNAQYFDTTDDSISELVNGVNSIKESYVRDSLSELRLNVDRSYRHRVLLHAQMFHFHYNNGLLNYMEQEIKRIESTYEAHNSTIMSVTGLSVADFIECFIALENIQRFKEHDSKLIFREPELTKALATLFTPPQGPQKGDVWEEVEKLPVDLKEAFLKYCSCPHHFLKVTVDELADHVGNEKARFFLQQLSTDPTAHNGYSFYDQPNPLELYPLLRIDGSYLHTNSKQLLVAINELLFKTLAKSKSHTKACQLVEKELERQTQQVLKRFFNIERCKIYSNYYINGSLEQDLLIDIGSKLIVCECKSTQIRDPLRDVDKFYVRAQDDFKKSVQKGYLQGERVVDLITTQDETILHDRKKKELGRITRRSPSDVSLWIVTDRSLGPSQVDLSYMLKSKRPLNEFPWSVCIDDLETFLLYLAQKPKPFSRLFDYLKHRPYLYGSVICPDELDLAGLYVSDRSGFIDRCYGEQHSPVIDLQLQGVFDQQYHSDEGLGFDSSLRDLLWNEEDLERSSSGS